MVPCVQGPPVRGGISRPAGTGGRELTMRDGPGVAMGDGPESTFAVLGGRPAFATPRHVGYPNIGNRQTLMRRIEEVLDRAWLTNNGPMVNAFEHEVASLAGTRHCVATCNGTLALEIAVRAAGLTGEVITTPF